MIYIQKADGLQAISSQLTKEKIIAALGYTPADNATFFEDETGALLIADNAGYVIARIDEEGLTTTKVSANTIQLDGENLATKLQELEDKVPDVDLTGYATEKYVDDALANLDIEIPEMDLSKYALNADVEANKILTDAHAADANIHVTVENKAAWDAKSDFNGDFNSLSNAPHIVNDNEDEVVICDSQGNVILRATAEGLNVPALYVNNKYVAADTIAYVPDYWKTTLDAKIATINAINGETGYNGISFMFLTDTHWPKNNGKSIPLINYIANNTSTKTVFFGGDMIHGDGANASIANYARNMMKQFDTNLKIYPIRGNHDTTSTYLKDTQWFDIFHHEYTNTNKMYYTKDDNAHQIRYIFLDSIAPETDVTEYYAAQLNWMKERIQELQAGWNVIIVTHAVWANGTNNTTWGIALTNALDEIYDVVNANIVAVFSGHNHKDHMIVADKGYAVIATTADGTISSEIGAAGTNTEQAFDVVNINLTTNTITLTRIGKGNDRSIVYNTKN